MKGSSKKQKLVAAVGLVYFAVCVFLYPVSVYAALGDVSVECDMWGEDGRGFTSCDWIDAVEDDYESEAYVTFFFCSVPSDLVSEYCMDAEQEQWSSSDSYTVAELNSGFELDFDDGTFTGGFAGSMCGYYAYPYVEWTSEGPGLFDDGENLLIECDEEEPPADDGATEADIVVALIVAAFVSSVVGWVFYVWKWKGKQFFGNKWS